MSNFTLTLGTGKSFIGAELAHAILQVTTQKILVVCYTNHALDQFLVQLMKKGERRIVRIGGRSNEEELEKFNFFNLRKQQRPDQDRKDKLHMYSLLNEQSELRSDMEDALKVLGAQEPAWDRVREILEEENPDALNQLEVPACEDGFQVVDREVAPSPSPQP